MIKKIVAVLLSVLLITSVAICSVSADSMVDELTALNIIPSNFNSEDAQGLVTRAELAYIASRLLLNEEIQPKTTKFTDVGSDNPYSGYVDFLSELGIINGVDAKTYLPDGNVTAHMAYKVMVNVLGYTQIAESLGGYPEGYALLADRLGFTTNLTISGDYLTRGGALNIAYYVLTNCFNKLIYFTDDNQLVVRTDTKSDFSVLADRHHISVYNAVLDSVSATNRANVTILSNKYDTNPEIIKSGSVVSFDAADKNIHEYEGANVTLWVNEHSEIVYIAPHRNSEIKYGYVDAVNGNFDSQNLPSVSSLSEITLINDEEDYDVSENVKVRYNGKIVTNTVKLVGNFARFVFQNDEITFIETWDTVEGGIISAVSPEYIEYTKGATSGLKLKDLNKFKNKRIYIDKEPAAEGHIKADTVFDYYADGETVVILISEKKIVDDFYSYQSNALEIGDSLYKFKKLYYSENTAYKEDKGFDVLLGSEISAYIAPDEYVRYIKVNDASKLTKTSFYGVVYGVNTDVFNEEAEIGVWVYGTEITKETYKVDNKTVFADNLTLEEIDKNANNIDGYGVYVFTLNSKGTIAEIKKPTPFYGYGVDIADKNKRVSKTVSTVDSDTNTYVPVSYEIPNEATTDDLSDKVTVTKRLYFKNAPMMAIFEANDEFIVQKTTQNAVLGKSGMNVTLTFFGDEEKSELPTMVLLTGDVAGLGGVYTQYGILMEKRIGISDSGEEKVDLYVTKGDSTPLVYSVSKEYAQSLPEKALLAYKEETAFSENDIYISSVLPLEGDSADWEISNVECAVGLHEGVFEKVEGKRLYLDDTAYFLHPGTSGKPIVKYDKNAGDKAIKVIDISEITPGSNIYYYLAENGIVRAIIVTD